MEIKSSQIIYSEHHYDECFEYKDGKGRVPDGEAIGYNTTEININGSWTSLANASYSSAVNSSNSREVLVLFDDIKYSEYDHDYWDNYELEQDTERVFIP